MENGPVACDICKSPISLYAKQYVDGAIKGSSSWGYMCIPCWNKHGMGLGTGRGQLYAKGVGPKYVKIAG